MKNRNKRLAGCVRWPGITVAAQDFGCHRIHLWRVLGGKKRDLRGYRGRYAAWRREHGL